MSDRLIVLDTCVIIAALRSRRGASNRLLQSVGTARFDIAVSVPLVLEYEEATANQLPALVYTREQVDGILGYLCSVAERRAVHFLWRAGSRGASDDMVLEIAVASGCDCLVTFNRQHLVEAEAFGVRVLTPGELLREIGG